MVRIFEARVPRMVPPLTDVDRPFWTSGRDGTLRIQRCTECGRWVHPPEAGACGDCGGELAFEPVSGRGTIFTFTVDHQQFHPDVPPPYVIALVELDEQPDLRLPANIVASDPEALECGTRVQVCFERHGEVYVPVFEPAP